MRDPITMTLSRSGTTLASTGIGLVGHAQQAASQQAMYDYHAPVARNTSIMTRRLATDATERGRIEKDTRCWRTAQTMGTPTAILAGRGAKSPILARSRTSGQHRRGP